MEEAEEEGFIRDGRRALFAIEIAQGAFNLTREAGGTGCVVFKRLEAPKARCRHARALHCAQTAFHSVLTFRITLLRQETVYTSNESMLVKLGSDTQTAIKYARMSLR